MEELIVKRLRIDFSIVESELQKIATSEITDAVEQLRLQLKIRNCNIANIKIALRSMIEWQRLENSTEMSSYTYNILQSMYALIDPSADIKLFFRNDSDRIRKKILISHSGRDKSYCDTLLEFLLNIGIDDDNIIYTSSAEHGVPLNERIYDFLKNQFLEDLYVIFVLSENYFNSVPTLNEMGAAWVSSTTSSSISVPGFDFKNEKYHNCVIDSSKLVGDMSERYRMIELKNKLAAFFNLHISEKKLSYALDRFENHINQN